MSTLKGNWAEEGQKFLEHDPSQKKPTHGIGYYIFPRDGTEWVITLFVMAVSAGFFALVTWQQDWNWWISIGSSLVLGYVGNIVRLRT